MKTIHRASYTSRNFDFEAYALTKAEAHALLLEGLGKHARQYILREDWFNHDFINYEEIQLNVCYRDREELI